MFSGDSFPHEPKTAFQPDTRCRRGPKKCKQAASRAANQTAHSRHPQHVWSLGSDVSLVFSPYIQMLHLDSAHRCQRWASGDDLDTLTSSRGQEVKSPKGREQTAVRAAEPSGCVSAWDEDGDIIIGPWGHRLMRSSPRPSERQGVSKQCVCWGAVGGG